MSFADRCKMVAQQPIRLATGPPAATCATCEGSGCACHPSRAGHPPGLIGWTPCGECGGTGRSDVTVSRLDNPFTDLISDP